MKDLFMEFQKADGVFTEKKVDGADQVYIGMIANMWCLKRESSLEAEIWEIFLLWNLIFCSMLNKAGVKLVFDDNMLVLTRNGEFVGKAYVNVGFFLLDIVTSNFNEKYLFFYLNFWACKSVAQSFGRVI